MKRAGTGRPVSSSTRLTAQLEEANRFVLPRSLPVVCGSMLLVPQSFVKTLVKLVSEGSALRKPSSKLPSQFQFQMTSG